MIIVVDFDGTCVTHEYPKIGKDIGAIPVLKRLIEERHRLVLFTMRSGVQLDNAVNWFKENNIELYGIQINPSQKTWTTSPKAYGNLYIDDAALGCPLKIDNTISDNPFVDWNLVEKMLMERKILKYL